MGLAPEESALMPERGVVGNVRLGTLMSTCGSRC